MICKNCDSNFSSKFCPDCGQKAETHAITVGHVIHDFIHSITHADKGFLLLAKELILRPGSVALEYIGGRRKRYYNPLSFLVIVSALFIYIGMHTGYIDSLSGASSAGHGPRSAIWSEVFDVVKSGGKWLILFLVVPVYSFVSRLFFIRKPFNYAEHFVLHSFLIGESTLFRMLVNIPLFLLLPENTTLNLLVFELISFVYLTVAYKQFFQQHLALIMIKVLFVRILFIVAYWVIIFGYVFTKHALL